MDIVPETKIMPTGICLHSPALNYSHHLKPHFSGLLLDRKPNQKVTTSRRTVKRFFFPYVPTMNSLNRFILRFPLPTTDPRVWCSVVSHGVDIMGIHTICRATEGYHTISFPYHPSQNIYSYHPSQK